MAVTVHPPLTQPDVEPIVDNRGTRWTVGTMSTLDVLDEAGVIVATFAAQSWGWAERT